MYKFSSQIVSIQQTTDQGYIMASTGTGTHNGVTTGDYLIVNYPAAELRGIFPTNLFF